jgi:hypothetical protein
MADVKIWVRLDRGMAILTVSYRCLIYSTKTKPVLNNIFDNCLNNTNIHSISQPSQSFFLHPVTCDRSMPLAVCITSLSNRSTWSWLSMPACNFLVCCRLEVFELLAVTEYRCTPSLYLYYSSAASLHGGYSSMGPTEMRHQ